MPRNGTGQYIAPASSWNPGVNGVTAQTADFNALLDDLEAGLSQSVSSDGQTPMTGNLPMGNNKITGLANGTANTDAAALGQVVRNIGQCRLTKSGSNLLLSPYQGNQLAINGALYTIPSAGVTLAPGSVTPSTLYYIYAYMVGATMTLEAVTTGHSTDINTGVEIKTGDATRTLVGMARPIAGPLWQDTFNQRFVVSWFNRKPVEMRAVLASNQAVANATYGEISSTLRLEFLQWLGESAQFNFQGSMTGGTGGAVFSTQLSYDSVTSTSESYSDMQAYTAGAFLNPACNLVATASATEGYHLVTPLARQSGGATATYIGSGTSGARCVTNGIVPV
jgi:hypothetical protein